MNNLLNTLYWNVWAQLGPLDAQEEEGAEAIEWIAMVAVILILLLAVQPIFQQGGTTIGGEIVSAISTWIAKFAK